MAVFADLDLLFGFVSLMLASGTVVAAGTEAAAALGGMRTRYLRDALGELLAQLDPSRLSPSGARQLAEQVLHHPCLRGFSRSGASVLRREDLVRLLVELSSGAPELRGAFGFKSPAQARAVSRSITIATLRLETEHPAEAPSVRRTRAVVCAMGLNPRVAFLHAWYEHAMARATRRYRRAARLTASLLALGLVLATQLDLLEFFRMHPATHWPGLTLSWLFISLGTPFWYDRLKDLMHLRPSTD